MGKKKNWRAKLANAKDRPKVIPIAPEKEHFLGTGTMVIPAPAEVDEIMKMVPRGKLITIREIKEALAGKHGTTTSCHDSTIICVKIAAAAAEEDAADGIEPITPYWRTLKYNGGLHPKYPGGIENLKTRLEEEGHTVISIDENFYVQDYERFLVKV